MKGGQKARAFHYASRWIYNAFDHPYITTMGLNEDRIPFVRYQILPAEICGHRVNVVYAEVRVQPTLIVKVPSGHFHCIRCKLMGNIETLRSYNCR